MRYGLRKRSYRFISGIRGGCFALTLGLCIGILPAGWGYKNVRAEGAQAADGTVSESGAHAGAAVEPSAASQQEHGPGVEIIIMPADVPIIILPRINSESSMEFDT